jgi:hypothetical protein
MVIPLAVGLLGLVLLLVPPAPVWVALLWSVPASLRLLVLLVIIRPGEVLRGGATALSPDSHEFRRRVLDCQILFGVERGPGTLREAS